MELDKAIALFACSSALRGHRAFEDDQHEKKASQDYASQRDEVTGEGARKAGGRYNAKGSSRALYKPLALPTATNESLAYSRQQGIPDPEVLPLTFVSLRV